MIQYSTPLASKRAGVVFARAWVGVAVGPSRERVGRPGGDEGHGGGGGVVGDHGLLDLLLHVGDVPEGPHRAHALQRHHGYFKLCSRDKKSFVRRY